MRKTLIILPMLALLAGCNLNLVDSDQSSLVVPPKAFSGTYPNPWYIYDEAYNTGPWVGGLGLYEGGPTAAYTSMTINFADTSKPFRGKNCLSIRYAGPLVYNPGPPVAADYIGGTFTHTPDFTAYGSTPGRDIHVGNYTKCLFYAAADAPNQVKFEAQGVTIGFVALTTSYQSFQINLPSPGSQTAVKDFFGFTYVAPNTTGPITVYIDDLRYE